jgi:hypothetical protein
MAKLLQVLGSHFSPAQRTLLLVNLASITEKADEALLPAVRFFHWALLNKMFRRILVSVNHAKIDHDSYV